MFTFYLNKYWLIFARLLVLDCFFTFYYSFVFYIFIVTVEINSKYSKIQQVTDDNSELMPKRLLQLECEKSSQKMQLRVSAIISQLFQVNMPAKCVLRFLGLNWNQRFPDKKTTLKIYGQVLAPPTRRQNRSFHVVAGKDANSYEIICNYKHAKLFFIVKHANL